MKIKLAFKLILFGLLVVGLTACAATPGASGELFTPKDLAGHWTSAKVEPVEGPNPIYGYWDFTLTENTWSLIFTAYADPEGKVKLFQFRVDESPYKLGDTVTTIPNTRTGDFTVSKQYMTAFTPDMAKLYADSKCGLGPWEVGVEQDVTQTGCTFIHSHAECPMEYDLVVFDGTKLALGDRSGNMCQAGTRPAKPSTHSLERVK